jgi:hypothetical protein
MSKLTGFLYAHSSFIEGYARILDLGDTLTEYNRSETPQQADYYAMFADWRAVGQDMIDAIGAYRREYQSRLEERVSRQKATKTAKSA